jgi:hypothetical protein
MKNATTETTPTKLVTTRREYSAPNAEFGKVAYLTTETLFADGRIDHHCVGELDGRSLNEKGTRNEGRTLDLAFIAEARRGMGYRIISLT